MSVVTPKEPKLDPNQLARQRKKIEKDRRRKQYDDLQVQGTNNSSIVSKRSVEILYTNRLEPQMGEWFKYFVKKGKRRSPAINRGYWIRMESIKQMILRIVDNNIGKKVHIVNLGCGFDPLPYQLLHLQANKGKESKLHFLDLDYPELVQNKLGMINESPEILKVIGKQNLDENLKKNGVVMSTDTYKLIGCDLKNTKLYEDQLNQLLGDDPNSIKIFVAEVSLAYMKPEFANPVISISSKLPNSHFLILEQILPNTKYNSFATKMMYHFGHLRSPLQCVETYPTKEDQIKRFKEYYCQVEIKNLFENWLFLIDDKQKALVEEIEEFDEWEEFIIFCQHYVIVHSTNMDSTQLVYKDIGDNYRQDSLEIDPQVKFTLDTKVDKEILELKFPAVCSLNDKQILVHGGLRQTRSNEQFVYDRELEQVEKVEFQGEISPRMCHTLISTDNNNAVLIGGRTRPGVHLKDIYKLQGQKWVKSVDLPCGRSRHAVVKLNESEVLIFGGLSVEDESKEELFLVYNVNTEAIKPLKDSSGLVKNLLSCAMTYNGEYGLIMGGMANQRIPIVNNKLYKFTIKDDTISTEVFQEGHLFARIGAQVQFIEHDKIVIIGGISTTEVFNDYNNIITYDLQSLQVRGVEIPLEIRKTFPPIFIGFGCGKQTREDGKKIITILGGGAVCYSFGSCYNAVYNIEY
ncbi:carboxymethyltransferase [Scheffersomyces xylosifermentans]|uniref:carboxymethyltransferase n=1 Tax=Scheffersomyces xylosifermentans TaxID=1304137 RepID=UPI00315D6634